VASEEFRFKRVRSIETELQNMHGGIARFAAAGRKLLKMLDDNPDLSIQNDFQWGQIAEEFHHSTKTMVRLAPGQAKGANSNAAQLTT
jgi:hypothetical protein